MRIAGLFFFILFFFPVTLFSQVVGAPRQKEKNTDTSATFAIILGISDYKQINPLKYADKDAVQLFLYLQAAFPTFTNNLFIFLNDKVLKASVEAKLAYIDGKVKPGDKVILYFSGHGDIEEKDSTGNFLFLLGNAQNKNYQQRENEVLEKRFFDSYISRWIERRVKTIFICDACRSGTLIGGIEGAKNNSLGFLQSWEGQSKILACQPNELSYEFRGLGGGSGTFTYYLILGLSGLADVNKDGKISLLELQTWLTGKVPDYVQREGAGQSQIPEITGDKSYIISNINKKLLSQATIQLTRNTATREYLQLADAKGKAIQFGDNTFQYKSAIETGSGNGFSSFDATDFAGTISDNYLKSIYYDFVSKIKKGDILLPEKSCAYSDYARFSEQKDYEPVKKEMRVQLLDALSTKYDDILNYLYSGDESNFNKELALYSAQSFDVIARLAGMDEVLQGKNKQRQLFASASLKLMRQPDDSVDTMSNELLSSLADFQQLLKIDSLSPYILLQAGSAFFLGKKYSEAAACYERYKKQLPNDEHIYLQLARVYIAEGQKAKAEMALQKALALNPGFTEALELQKK